MATILVSVVSMQTLPNYLFIKEHIDKADIFLFISTREMESDTKTRLIYETAGIDKRQVRKILVSEDALYLIKNKLDRLGWQNAGHKYLVNITGGTKLMAIAVYEYFSEYNSRFFYLPAGKNCFREIFRDSEALKIPIKTKITLAEYLQIYGIDFNNKHPRLTEQQVEALYDEFRRNAFSSLPHYHYPAAVINFQQQQSIWFEHFLYYRMKRILTLSDDAIALNCELKEKEPLSDPGQSATDNEIDIMFMMNNRIHIVEVKFSVGNPKSIKTNLTQYLYKLAAVKKRFGLEARAMLITFTISDDLPRDTQANLKKRCHLLRIHFPLFRETVINENLFKKEMDKFISL